MVLLLLRKVGLLRYCFCMWLPWRKRDVGANTSTRRVSLESHYSWTKKEFLVEETLKSYLVCSLLVVFFWFSCVAQIVGKKNRWQILLSMPRQMLVWLMLFLDLKKGCSSSDAWRLFLFIEFLYVEPCILNLVNWNLQIVQLASWPTSNRHAGLKKHANLRLQVLWL